MKAEKPYGIEVKFVDCDNSVFPISSRMFEGISLVFTICIVRLDNKLK